MLNCELCDYFKTAKSNVSNVSKCMCEFTGFVFHKNPEEYDMEKHPCYDYEVSKKPAEIDEIEVAASELRPA